MGLFDDLKGVAEVLNKAGTIEEYKQILEAQQEYLALQKQVWDLEKKNKELKEKIEKKEKVVFEKGLYWLVKNEGKEGPFCPNCYQGKENKLISLIEDDSSYACQVCNKTINEVIQKK